jgi:hypothetical protein
VAGSIRMGFTSSGGFSAMFNGQVVMSGAANGEVSMMFSRRMETCLKSCPRTVDLGGTYLIFIITQKKKKRSVITKFMLFQD